MLTNRKNPDYSGLCMKRTATKKYGEDDTIN